MIFDAVDEILSLKSEENNSSEKDSAEVKCIIKVMHSIPRVMNNVRSGCVMKVMHSIPRDDRAKFPIGKVNPCKISNTTTGYPH